MAFTTLTGTVGQNIVRIDTVLMPYFEFDSKEWVYSDNNHPLFYQYGGVIHYCGGIPQVPFHLLQDSIYESEHNPNGSRYGFRGYLNGDHIQYNYIEGGATIHGIAVWSAPNPIPSEEDLARFNYFMEDVYLYDATPDTLMLLEVAPFPITTPLDTFDIEFARAVPVIPQRDSCVPMLDTVIRYYFAPQCVYFDKPIRVYDSFYVGASQRWTENLYNPEGPPPPGPRMYDLMKVGNYGENFDSTCWPTLKIKQRWTLDSAIDGGVVPRPRGYVQGQWINRYMIDFYMIVPIIETYDTLWDYELVTCPQVEWFNVTGTRGDTTTLRWQSADDLHAEWQLSYGPKGIDPDNGTLVDCRAASWRYIDSLHTRDSMSAWVRTVCRDEGYLRYSDWSHEVSWGGRDSTVLWTEQPQGNIRLEGLVRLTPNPATDEVTIASAYRLTGVEVYSMDGRLRYQAPAQGLTCRFAVQGWTRGTYLVLVQTAAGTSTKKLVVNP